jgi:L-2,4-diaminobutyrate decarboxylase
MVDGFTNNAMAIYEMGPAAAAIEYFLINWLLDKVGWAPAPYSGATAPEHGATAPYPYSGATAPYSAA